MKLYLCTTNIKDFYIIAKDPTDAENKLTEILDKNDYGFYVDRKVTNIKILGESIEFDYTGKTYNLIGYNLIL